MSVMISLCVITYVSVSVYLSVCLSVCSLRVELIEARNMLSRLNADYVSRRGYQHDKQLENLRALQVTDESRGLQVTVTSGELSG